MGISDSGLAEMEVLVSTYPPLGRVTKLDSPYVGFLCVLVVDLHDAGDGWQVVLRYAPLGSDNWTEHSLAATNRSLFSARQNDGKHQLLFETEITINSASKFEISFRQNNADSWSTARGRNDGDLESVVLLVPQISLLNEKAHDLKAYVEELNSDLYYKLLDDGSDSGILSWLVEAPIAAASGDSPYMDQVMFGKPFGGNFLRYVRPKWWKMI